MPLEISEEEVKNIEPLIYEVQYLLSISPKEQVIENLKKFQIDENIIGVLVDNVIRTSLSFDAFARALRELNDDTFKKVISGMDFCKFHICRCGKYLPKDTRGGECKVHDKQKKWKRDIPLKDGSVLVSSKEGSMNGGGMVK